MIERLSDEKLQEIEKRLEYVLNNEGVFDGRLISEDIPKLITEVRQLRKELEKSRGILSDALDGINELTHEDLHTEVYEFLYGGDDE